VREGGGAEGSDENNLKRKKKGDNRKIGPNLCSRESMLACREEGKRERERPRGQEKHINKKEESIS